MVNVLCGVFAGASVLFLAASLKTRKLAYAVLTAISGIATISGLVLWSCWPFAIAGGLMLVFLFVGSGGWYEEG